MSNLPFGRSDLRIWDVGARGILCATTPPGVRPLLKCEEPCKEEVIGPLGGTSCPEGAVGFLPIPGTDAAMPFFSGPCYYACLAEGTMVDSEAGALPIERLSAGDMVRGVALGGAQQAQEVLRIEVSVQPCVEVVCEAGRFVCSHSHLLITAGKESLRAKDLAQGDLLLDKELQPTRVVQVSDAGRRRVVGLHCVPDHLFFAAGVLHHNATAKAIPTSGVTVPGIDA